jgi:hypothetical protein
MCVVDTDWRKKICCESVDRLREPSHLNWKHLTSALHASARCDHLETFCFSQLRKFLLLFSPCPAWDSWMDHVCNGVRGYNVHAVPSDEFRGQIFRGFNRFFIPSPLTAFSSCLCVCKDIDNAISKKSSVLRKFCGASVGHRDLPSPIRYLSAITAHHTVQGRWGRRAAPDASSV